MRRVLALWLVSCGGGGASPPVTPPPVEASSCELPAPPDLGQLAGHVVGDGTAGSCTQASLQAALDQGGDVSFDCGDAPLTIAVASPLQVPDRTRLDGGGKVTLDGGGSTGILETAQSSTVIIQGLSFVRGHASAGGAISRGWQSDLYVKDCLFQDSVATGENGAAGGAIYAGSAGWLTIVGSTFSGNQAPFGGATHTVLSDLTVVDSVFSGNRATDGDGGAIFTDGGYVPMGGENGQHGGKISLCGVRFTGNQATSSAGAGFLFAYGQDQLLVNRCDFSDNQVTGEGLGGALRIDAIAFVSNSLFARNQCAGQGGALWIGRGPVRFENVTFFANNADLYGGAISYDRQQITLQSCTLAYNTSPNSPGLFGGEEHAPEVHDSLLVESGCRRALVATHTMVFPADESCGPDVEATDPQLERELADHGGFTHTLALPATSPALGVGTDCPATDQRGEPRDPTACDLGAYEVP